MQMMAGPWPVARGLGLVWFALIVELLYGTILTVGGRGPSRSTPVAVDSGGLLSSHYIFLL